MGALVTITCASCGGSVAMEAGRRRPACLFCGAETLMEDDRAEQIEAADTYVPFDQSEAQARAVFKEWASKKFWAPSEIRGATLGLNGLLLPAWTWSGTVETHWAALIRARTQSGKRPTSGSESWAVDGVLVPASRSLTRAELAEISPFQSAVEPFDAEEADLPFELGQLTRTAARAAGTRAMRELHAARLEDDVSAVRLSTSCLFHDLEGTPVLLPIWIGAYRVGDKPYRVVLNGQTGAITGTAPVSWVKIAIAVGIGAAIMCAGLMFFGVGALILGQ
ncbi:MAG: hypothetical protein GY898_33460 [Proteobacteria bacterium]|nr:hypothetical protein [Pseudomonadota bacterium]